MVGQTFPLIDLILLKQSRQEKMQKKERWVEQKRQLRTLPIMTRVTWASTSPRKSVRMPCISKAAVDKHYTASVTFVLHGQIWSLSLSQQLPWPVLYTRKGGQGLSQNTRRPRQA